MVYFYNFHIIWPGTPYDNLINISGREHRFQCWCYCSECLEKRPHVEIGQCYRAESVGRFREVRSDDDMSDEAAQDESETGEDEDLYYDCEEQEEE